MKEEQRNVEDQSNAKPKRQKTMSGVALAVATNSIEQFNSVTPSEVTLVHQLIHCQTCFLQMECLYREACIGHGENASNEAIANNPPKDFHCSINTNKAGISIEGKTLAMHNLSLLGTVQNNAGPAH